MLKLPRVFFIDNFDSFSFNLVYDFRCRGVEIDVWRNDLEVERALELIGSLPLPGLVVLSPGPGAPQDAGCCVPLVQRLAGKVPIFGVCLGHQVIVEAMGGKVGYAGEVVHGKASPVFHEGVGLFAGMPNPLMAGRYHSLSAQSVPDDFLVTAQTQSLVMAIEHKTLPLSGVQFHPESILTPAGGLLIDRVLSWSVRHSIAGPREEV